MRILLDSFTKTFGDVTVIKDMNLDIKSGEMLALLGPSGCGKSTTLFAICGIHGMDGGRLLFGDKDVTSLPSQKRNVGVVFQNYALYPHMNVWENIAFPLKIQKRSKAVIEKEVQAMAELVQIEELLDRKPVQLSGGQQQRVALARALVRKPDILLLDEPLANLDAKLRLEMRSEIRRIQQQTGITAVLVTHDQVEAMSMCDRIAIMNGGKIVQLSAPEEMYRNPSSDFVAGFLGNPPIAFLEGVIKDSHCHLHGGETRVALNGHAQKVSDGQKIKLGIRPEFFRPEFDLKVKGKISFIEAHGRENLYDVVLDNGDILRSIQNHDAQYQLGQEVTWGICQDNILAFDGEGERL
ncbi:ABC transporter ATP-binding protein [Sansalvadorimonas sp. 2012CJ34-2]|uniref:ABC transporter ATP-binding protein n=1 Tax=Parendozoicomonas callyspongiae TaxID=2942213 RepID=A0ABT0PDG6_9GAMM|nr:ABC transporter ATP-binding protein [Sansalvadorimonas sp. 2012CJ34-2]MCL6269380.1 ABC transporter ATP-binding protein [Sansalvadorimonas sp. 2012CJ34-2]